MSKRQLCNRHKYQSKDSNLVIPIRVTSYAIGSWIGCPTRPYPNWQFSPGPMKTNLQFKPHSNVLLQIIRYIPICFFLSVKSPPPTPGRPRLPKRLDLDGHLSPPPPSSPEISPSKSMNTWCHQAGRCFSLSGDGKGWSMVGGGTSRIYWLGTMFRHGVFLSHDIGNKKYGYREKKFWVLPHSWWGAIGGR